jgi:hypothetical protein
LKKAAFGPNSETEAALPESSWGTPQIGWVAVNCARTHEHEIAQAVVAIDMLTLDFGG